MVLSRWWAAWLLFWVAVALYVIFGPALPALPEPPTTPPLTELQRKELEQQRQLRWEQEQQQARAERERAAAVEKGKEKRSESLCVLAARCKKFFAARLECAAAPDFKSCVQIRRSGGNADDQAYVCGGVRRRRFPTTRHAQRIRVFLFGH